MIDSALPAHWWAHASLLPRWNVKWPARVRGWVLLLLLGVTGAAWGQAAQVEIIPLHYRQAESLLPVLRASLPGMGINGIDNRLIARGTPAQIAALKQLLSSLDTQPRQLLITVEQSEREALRQSSAQVSGSVGGISVGRTTIDRHGQLHDRPATLRGEVAERLTRGSSQSVQQIRVLEGYPAMIQTGTAIPWTFQQVTHTAQGVVVTQGTEYVEAVTGVYVVARLSGDQVTLEVNPRKEAWSADGSLKVQGVMSTVSGRLGSWLFIGGQSGQSSQSRVVLLGSGSQQQDSTGGVRVKVDEVR